MHQESPATRAVLRQAQPSQREAQLEDVADYQTAYQSARTVAVNGGHGSPIASISAGPPHRPTVDGMEQGRQRHCRPAERRGRPPPYDRGCRPSSGSCPHEATNSSPWAARTSRSTAPASSSSTTRSSAHLHRKAWVAPRRLARWAATTDGFEPAASTDISQQAESSGGLSEWGTNSKSRPCWCSGQREKRVSWAESTSPSVSRSTVSQAQDYRTRRSCNQRQRVRDGNVR
jgi:hypothetical protein